MNVIYIFLLILSIIVTKSFSFVKLSSSIALLSLPSQRFHVKTTTKLFSEIDPQIREKIETLVSKNKILLFMKGNKLFPQCGFSNTACRILDALNANYETVNVLEDDRIRNGIKVFSSWPTIPQLYINGEFIGGSDIMIELYQKGELAEMIELANAN